MREAEPHGKETTTVLTGDYRVQACCRAVLLGAEFGILKFNMQINFEWLLLLGRVYERVFCNISLDKVGRSLQSVFLNL